ncbi:MAG: acyl-ACP--UDP-N-acetylglucosamine O-acyltransferase [Puniceicoccales bacterium]|jgi:UDP-N-acetylglucosamine acyltransferase|nr:acyl-ACP--UDP-N-acetylglucosamine O-acyltransferase [Puniceicoccales bacterium]
MIHPAAIVPQTVKIGTDVAIGPYAVIEDGVVLGDRCQIAAHAVIKSGAVLEEEVQVDHHAVISGLPQDTGFDPGTPSGVIVGRGTRIREGVTLHRATKAGASTIIGPGCYLMALAHVAHDCVLGEHVIIANAAMLGGHVHVGDRAFVSGGVVVHQFVRLGESTMCSGNGRFGMDVPPFTIALERNHIAGLNLVGLRRRGFTHAIIADIKNCYRAVYRDDTLNLVNNATEALASGLAKTPQGRQFLEFFTDASARHQFIRPRKNGDAE